MPPCALVSLSHSLDLLFLGGHISLVMAGVVGLLLFFSEKFTIGEDFSSEGNQSACLDGQTHSHTWRKIPTVSLLWHS